MTNKQIEFEQWYDIALSIYNRKFKGLRLDIDAAQYGYDDGQTPEEYIKEMEDQID